MPEKINLVLQTIIASNANCIPKDKGTTTIKQINSNATITLGELMTLNSTLKDGEDLMPFIISYFMNKQD